MADLVAEIQAILAPDKTGAWVSNMWNNYWNQSAGQRAKWAELDQYIFATDTTSTSNQTLPWKNSTTLPKLCQIRDNLHSNYLSSIFPNDKWLQWKGYTKKDANRKKAQAITAYMENKTRESNYRTTVSRLLLDYIDRGNAFATVAFEKRYNTLPNGAKAPAYIGPIGVRISPDDIVFNPTADTFENSFKIIRSVKTLGELKKLAATQPEMAFWEKAVQRREEISRKMGAYGVEDFNKAAQYAVDGFGNLYDYYQSNYVEILEFYGDYHDVETGELHTSRMITVVDRSLEVRNEAIATYSGRAPIRHVGWRLRPNNLWAMGPLENLVGMQYRIDHLENLKADAMDLAVMPPLAIVGEVEEFTWGPRAEIHMDEGGTISELVTSLNSVITADNQIAELEDRMELFAGAPREAMGVRTPGEKTALEVQTLNNAAGRIFTEKTTNFELGLMEPNLNDQLEIAVRNFDQTDVIRTMDNDLGFEIFRTITVEDLTASGILRPVGARHFAQQAQELQNIIGIFNSPIAQMIAPHTSGIAMTQFVEDVTALSGYNMFRPNVAVIEAHETQSLVNQSQEDQQVAATMPPEASGVPPDVPPEGAPIQ